MNYRAGAFGFLPSVDLEKEGSLNVGIWDVAESFKWMRKYIQHFGGDPRRITAFGLSSGGMIISNLMVADNGTLDLFDVI
jgi:acetylcholinesterase